MVRKFLLSLTFIFVSFFLFGKPVTTEFAQSIAIKWYAHHAALQTTDFTVKEIIPTTYNGMITYYTFIFNAGGFVMIAADDASEPVIGYSIENNFDKNNIPPNALAFFQAYSREIKSIVDAGLDNTLTLKSWNDIKHEVFAKEIAAVNPLCSTTWDQGYPYNAMCPGSDPTGCVATAMAQIMKKWAYPTTGNGSHSYIPTTHPEYGTLTANFAATTYNWASMPNSAYTSNTALATLMFHAGVSVNMNYDSQGSWAYSQDVPTALVNYFRYQPSAECKYKAYFNTTNWMNLVKAELDAGRPIFLAGDDNATAGHAFVCDGYNTANKFHINWGWGGSSDGYFYLTSLNPSGSNFSSNNVAVIRIQPLSNAPIANFTANTTVPAIGEEVIFTDNSLNNPTSWLWTFEGGTPATSTSQNPGPVTFSTNGYHIVTLKVTNANGNDIKTREQYINVGGVPSAWVRQNTSFTSASRGIDQIFIVDQNTVWAKAYDGTNPSAYIREFTRTNDGGNTWTPGTISFTNSANYGVSNIFAVDYNTAYACMFPISGTGGKILKTTNGGSTWQEQTSATFTDSWANVVHFFNATDGFAMGDPVNGDFCIYTTSNGGSTWTQVAGANIPNAQTNECGITNLYQAVGNTVWFTTTMGRVYKSTDKGATWTVATTGFTDVFTMSFKDANVGFAVLSADPYTVKKTTNGGTTWTDVIPGGYFVSSAKLAFVPGTPSTWVNVASYPGKGSSFSTNDCATFNNIDTGSVMYTDVMFYDINTGWAGGFNESSTVGGIYKWDISLMTDIKEQMLSSNNINVFPVPSVGIVNISLGEIEFPEVKVEICNAVGAIVYSKIWSTVSNDLLQADLSSFDNGFYFVNVSNGNKKVTKKFMIIK